MCSSTELETNFEEFFFRDEENDSFERVLEITKPLRLKSADVEMIANVFHREISHSISENEIERRNSVLPMIRTFMTEIPDGSESGFYLGVDLGGTNFRIILAELNGIEQDFFTVVEPIPQELFYLPCKNIYDYMAAKLADFLDMKGLKDLSFKLGFTFSFPAVMDGVKSARLITWTKGFNCPDGVGEDMGQLFQDAINQRGDLKIELVCVMNDTTATLLAGAFMDHDCLIGVIVGTGSNAAYYEDLNNMKWFVDDHYVKQQQQAPKHMVINTEWGAFGDNGSLNFIRTQFDDQVDRNSLHVGSFTFEKMFSGLYYGELCRVVLLHLAEQGLFLRAPGGGPDRMPKQWQLSTVDVSSVNSDSGEGVYPNTFAVMQKLQLLQFCCEDDLRVMHHVCRTLTMRAGDIIAAACATLVRHVARESVAVAFDGSLYKHLPGLSSLIEQRLTALCPETKVQLLMVHDGSGKGCALGAAVADRYLKRRGNGGANEDNEVVRC